MPEEIRQFIALEYALTFDSSFHFGTGLRDGLIHRAMARDAADFLYVPGSTLKGALRERCEQLARLFNLEAYGPHGETSGRREAHPRPTIITRLFGSRFHPTELAFDDLPLDEAQRDLFRPRPRPGRRPDDLRAAFRRWQMEERTQVSLSRVTRTAEQGRLFTTQHGIPGLTFTGAIRGFLTGFPLEDEDWRTYSLLLLVAGLLSVDQLGGQASRGAGRLAQVQIKQLIVAGDNSPEPAAAEAAPAGEIPANVRALLAGLEALELYWIVREDAP